VQFLLRPVPVQVTAKGCRAAGVAVAICWGLISWGKSPFVRSAAVGTEVVMILGALSRNLS